MIYSLVQKVRCLLEGICKPLNYLQRFVIPDKKKKILGIPSENSSNIIDVNLTNNDLIGWQGSLESIKQSDERTLLSQGCIQMKMQIPANSDSFDNARFKMVEADKELKNSDLQVIKTTSSLQGHKRPATPSVPKIVAEFKRQLASCPRRQRKKKVPLAKSVLNANFNKFLKSIQTCGCKKTPVCKITEQCTPVFLADPPPSNKIKQGTDKGKEQDNPGQTKTTLPVKRPLEDDDRDYITPPEKKQKISHFSQNDLASDVKDNSPENDCNFLSCFDEENLQLSSSSLVDNSCKTNCKQNKKFEGKRSHSETVAATDMISLLLTSSPPAKKLKASTVKTDSNTNGEYSPLSNTSSPEIVNGSDNQLSMNTNQPEPKENSHSKTSKSLKAKLLNISKKKKKNRKPWKKNLDNKYPLRYRILNILAEIKNSALLPFSSETSVNSNSVINNNFNISADKLQAKKALESPLENFAPIHGPVQDSERNKNPSLFENKENEAPIIENQCNNRSVVDDSSIRETTCKKFPGIPGTSDSCCCPECILCSDECSNGDECNSQSLSRDVGEVMPTTDKCSSNKPPQNPPDFGIKGPNTELHIEKLDREVKFVDIVKLKKIESLEQRAMAKSYYNKKYSLYLKLTNRIPIASKHLEKLNLEFGLITDPKECKKVKLEFHFLLTHYRYDCSRWRILQNQLSFLKELVIIFDNQLS